MTLESGWQESSPSFTAWPRTTNFGRITRRGGAYFQPRPRPKGRSLRTPQLWGSAFMHIHPLTQNDHVWQVTHVGGGGACFLRSVMFPILLGQSPALPNFGVLLYLCPHPLTQNDQIRHGITHGRGVFQEVSHADAFAQMRRAVCQRSFLFYCTRAGRYVLSDTLRWICNVCWLLRPNFGPCAIRDHGINMPDSSFWSRSYRT